MMEELDSEAAEYVLGTPTCEERAAFEARLASSAQARSAVEEWERRLAPLASGRDAVPPPPRVWHAIEWHLDMVPAHGGSDETSRMVSNLRRSRTRWRICAASAALLAAGLAAFSVNRLLVEDNEAANTYVAVVNRGGKSRRVKHH